MALFAGFSTFFCIIFKTIGLALMNGIWEDRTNDSGNPA